MSGMFLDTVQFVRVCMKEFAGGSDRVSKGVGSGAIQDAARHAELGE